MPRVIGIDPGTVSIDVCGLEDGQVFLDRSLPTSDVVEQPARLLGLLDEADATKAIDLVAGPSGYGLPLTRGHELSDVHIRLAQLTAAGERGGIVGLGALMRLLARSPLPVVFTPGVIHLPTVPAHRKINRVDMGTADKVCAAALALHDQVQRMGGSVEDASFILLELGGAFTAAVAAEGGRLVDGVGGTAGPLGLRSAGALDGEVAFLAGSVSKKLLFGGGVASVAGMDLTTEEALRSDAMTPRQQMAWDAYIEGAAKAVAALTVSVSRPREIILSGRLARIARVRDQLVRRLEGTVRDVQFHVLSGFAEVAKQAAQGAALVADGLCGGSAGPLVQRMRIQEASGTVVDHLHVISPADARARLGID